MFVFITTTISFFYVKKINADLSFAEKQIEILKQDNERQAALYRDTKALENKLDEIYVERAKEVENLSKDASAVRQEVAKIIEQRKNGETAKIPTDSPIPDAAIVGMLNEFCAKVNRNECPAPK